MKDPIIVIGADAAGLSAASKAKRLNPESEILIFDKGSRISYGLCGLPYFIGDEIKDINELVVFTPEKFKEKKGLDVLIHHEAIKANFEDKTVTIKNLKTSEETDYKYSKLIIATGASSRIIPFKGVNLQNIFTLHSLDDGVAIKSFIQTKSPKKAVIVGSGFIGLELCEAFAHYNIETTLVEKVEKITPIFDTPMSEKIEEKLNSLGIKTLKGATIEEFIGNNAVEKVKIDGKMYETDFVILSTGVVPNTQFLKNTDLRLLENGAIITNEKMETNIPDVYACGDCATVRHILTGENVYIPLGNTANKQGRIAGINVSGKKAELVGILGTTVAKVFDWEVAKTGLSEAEAKKLKIPYFSKMIKASNKAHYIPGRGPMFIQLVVDKDSKIILGAQMIGSSVSKRIDIYSTAIYNKMTLNDFMNLDLCYAPPVAPVWEPVQNAVRVIVG